MKANKINTPLVFDTASRTSRTSGSFVSPYCLEKLISLNSSRGTKAAKTKT